MKIIAIYHIIYLYTYTHIHLYTRYTQYTQHTQHTQHARTLAHRYSKYNSRITTIESQISKYQMELPNK